MSINLTDDIEVKTKKGKLGAAKQIFLEGDKQTVEKEIQDINSRHNTLSTKHESLSKTVQGIAATGGANTATNVTYDNTNTGITAENIQDAVDKLVKEKADATDVNTELDKKFNKENIAQEFGESKDKVVSQFALPFREIESSEFIKVIVDANDHLLFSINLDGEVDWGKGIPKPIRAKLEEIIAQCQQDKTDLTEALNTAKEELMESITDLQENKVDKEEGKSLIENEVKECFKVIENEEFIKAVVDSENRVLCGIYRATGKPYYPLNDMYHISHSEEFLWVILDAVNHPLLGIKKDGTCWAAKAQWLDDIKAIKEALSNIDKTLKTFQPKEDGKGLINMEIADSFFYISNDEYIIAVVDAEDRILAGIKYDGEPYFPNHEMYSVITNEEWLYTIIDAEGKVLGGFRADDGHMIVGSIDISNFIANAIIEVADIKKRIAHLSTIENDEYLSIETDADGKVLSYRDSEGKKHEHSMDVTNLDVSNLNLQGNSVNNIQDALKANGFNVKSPIDWSDSSFIQIPKPRFAIINITNIDSMPTTKTDNKKAFLEFWDMHGNYFKKYAILNAQGNSSLSLDKKNAALDLCDDEWVGDNTPKVRIGNWVPQDSFHLKAYYTDFFRGVGAVSYKLYDQIVRTRGNMYDRPWKKALLDMSKIGTTTKSIGNPYVGDYSLLTDTGARCFPDGFPVAVYLNGSFYGIFSFQLKKHRDNYHMDKSTPEHVHLDGELGERTIFGGRDKINWGAFEIRNPKGLYAIGGNKYDADVKQEEIAGDTEVNAWIEAGNLPDGKTIDSKIKKALQMTAKVKKYILNFADAVPTIKEAMNVYESSSKSEEDLKEFKAIYEKYFDKENLIDYMIVSDIIKNQDGFRKNWQWFTYDGEKWWVGLYDCDMSFGGHFQGNQITDILTQHLNTSIYRPNGYIAKYYSDEMNARYKYLADMGIISSDNIFGLIRDWTMRIGTSFFKEEYKKWADSPCASDSIIRSDYWELVKDEHGFPQTDTTETYDATTAYNVGEVVSFGLNELMGFFKFKCIKATKALTANTPHAISTYCPIKEFRHCDNIYRVQKWIEQNTKNIDSVYNYIRK